MKRIYFIACALKLAMLLSLSTSTMANESTVTADAFKHDPAALYLLNKLFKEGLDCIDPWSYANWPSNSWKDELAHNDSAHIFVRVNLIPIAPHVMWPLTDSKKEHIGAEIYSDGECSSIKVNFAANPNDQIFDNQNGFSSLLVGKANETIQLGTYTFCEKMKIEIGSTFEKFDYYSKGKNLYECHIVMPAILLTQIAAEHTKKK